LDVPIPRCKSKVLEAPSFGLLLSGGGSLAVAKILRALVLAHEQARISEAGLKVVGTFGYLEVAAAGSDDWVRASGPEGSNRQPTDVKVFAKKKFEKGQLVLVPVPRTSSSIAGGAISDKAIETDHSDEKGNPYKIDPCNSWDPKATFLHPFWLAKKVDQKQAANLHMIQLAVMNTVKCQGEIVSCLADQLLTDVTTVPVWTNPEDIEAGAEIVCHATSKKAPPKATAASTWASGRGSVAKAKPRAGQASSASAAS